MHSFDLIVVDLTRTIYKGKASSIKLTGADGELEILANHTPLITKIYPCLVELKTDKNEKITFIAKSGIVDVQKGKVSVLSDVIERTEDIDANQAELALNDARKMLENNSNEKEFDYNQVNQDLAFAQARAKMIKNMSKK